MYENKKFSRTIAFLLMISVAFSAAGCSRFKAPNYPLDYSLYSPKGTIGAEGQYVIGPRDELEILVWKCPELKTEVTVRPEDGNITVPLIGDIKAAGNTPKELAKAISKRLAYYVKSPRVAVGVIKFGEKKVFLLGEVFSPGTYYLEGGDRIIDVVGRAGGFLKSAVPSCTYVIRGTFDKPEIIRVNLGRLLYKGDISQNIYLKEGDIVYVPEGEIENLNYALRLLLPSFYFAERVSDLRNDIVNGSYDWNDVFKRGHRGF